MARFLYTFLLYFLLPFILLKMLWRSRKQSAYAKRWGERFGFFKLPDLQNSVWLHAVSVGETIAAAPVVKQLQKTYPNLSFVITTTTPTGSERVTALLSNVWHVYIPYDLPGALRRFLKKVKPNLVVIMETELWPNTLHYCAKRNIPIVIANARLSEKSAVGYQKIGGLTRKMLSQITMIAAQTQADAERFIQLGLDQNKITVIGNIKFDLAVPEEVVSEAKRLRESWGNRLTWIAASTHPGEEEVVLMTYHNLLRSIPNLLLVLVPRHPDRSGQIAGICQKLLLHYQLFSSSHKVNHDIQVLLVDTIGDLLTLYGTADVAFVGGSLVPVGGHNLLEPIAMNTPVITGPNLFNFTQMSQLLLTAEALKIVKNSDELAAQLQQLFQNPDLCQAMAQVGQSVLKSNQGALNHLIHVLEQQLDRAAIS